MTSTVSVPRERLVQVTDAETANFFDLLQSTISMEGLLACVEASDMGRARFGDILQTYLMVINDKLEELAPATMPDDEFVGIVNWVLLQGHAYIQEFMNMERLPWGRGEAPSAHAHWYGQ